MINREEWLNRAIDLLREHFKQSGIRLPKRIYISVGWTSYGVRSGYAAETWPKAISKDGSSSIFISPKLGNSKEVLTVLAHELVHVSLDCESVHGKLYREQAAKVGLVAPWDQAVADAKLAAVVDNLINQLGEYPFKGVKNKSQYYNSNTTNYWKKIFCPNCGSLARMTVRWINKGLPTCSCGHLMEVE